MGVEAGVHTSGPLGFLRFPFFYRPHYVLLLLGNAAIAAIVALLLYHLAALGMTTWARLPLLPARCGCSVSVMTRSGWWPSSCAAPAPRSEPVAALVAPAGPAWLAALLLDLGAAPRPPTSRDRFSSMADDPRRRVGSAGTARTARARRVRELRPPHRRAGPMGGVAARRLGTVRDAHLRFPGGYAESFSQAGSPAQAGILILSVLLFLALDGFRAWRSPDRFEALVGWGALGTLVWMTAKGGLCGRTGFTRCGPSRPSACFSRSTSSPAATNGSPSRLAFLLLALGLPGLFIVVAAGMPPKRPSLEVRLNTFSSFLRKGWPSPRLRTLGRAARSPPRSRARGLPTGSVGVFGSCQSLLLGHAGRHVVLPIVAPYEIWSPWTSRREREFLLGPEAPDYLLYTGSPASAELALTLAARYAEVERRPSYWLLRRRPVPPERAQACRPRDQRRRRGPHGVPPDWRTAPAVVEVRYTKTFTNTLISAVYQPPEAFLVLFRDRLPSRRSA